MTAYKVKAHWDANDRIWWAECPENHGVVAEGRHGPRHLEPHIRRPHSKRTLPGKPQDVANPDGAVINGLQARTGWTVDAPSSLTLGEESIRPGL
jgi:hypothetical protein